MEFLHQDNNKTEMHSTATPNSDGIPKSMATKQPLINFFTTVQEETTER